MSNKSGGQHSHTQIHMQLHTYTNTYTCNYIHTKSSMRATAAVVMCMCTVLSVALTYIAQAYNCGLCLVWLPQMRHMPTSKWRQFLCGTAMPTASVSSCFLVPRDKEAFHRINPSAHNLVIPERSNGDFLPQPVLIPAKCQWSYHSDV